MWVVILTVAGGTSLAVYTAEGLAAAVATFVAVVGLLHVVVAPR